MYFDIANIILKIRLIVFIKNAQYVHNVSGKTTPMSNKQDFCP